MNTANASYRAGKFTEAEVTYLKAKELWLILVAYPLWATNQLIGSPAEGMTYAFLWVALPIIAMPWKYAFENYIFKPKNVRGK